MDVAINKMAIRSVFVFRINLILDSDDAYFSSQKKCGRLLDKGSKVFVRLEMIVCVYPDSSQVHKKMEKIEYFPDFFEKIRIVSKSHFSIFHVPMYLPRNALKTVFKGFMWWRKLAV